MERRTFLTALVGAPALSLVAAACGSDDSADPVGDTLPGIDPTTPAPADPVADSAPPSTEAPAADEPAEELSDDPSSGGSDVLLEYGTSGGFTMREIAFQMQPNLLITSDLVAITPGATTAVFPGPLVPPNFRRSITPEAFDTIIAAADEAGLLADVEYESDPLIADAATTTLRLTVDGETYVHSADALGAGGPPGAPGDPSPDRNSLAEFLGRLDDLAGLVGSDQLGAEEPYEPDAYEVVALPNGDQPNGGEEPSIVEWPAEAGVALADLESCTRIDAAAVGELFADADQLTVFVDDGAQYQLLVRPALPGRSC